jgi:hypothetical protein
VRQLRRLARQTWVPFSLAAALVVSILVVVPWYYRTFKGVEPERGLSDEELAWVADYVPWQTDARRALEGAHDARQALDGTLDRLLPEAARCGDALAERVGPPPSRLEPVTEQAYRACGVAAAALDAFREAADTPNRQTTVRLGVAVEMIAEADRLLRRLLLAQRPLPYQGGADADTSRIEPLLSGAASTVLPVEVRCWAADEWPAVADELALVGRVGDPELARRMNAYRFAVHLSPAVCAPLVRFADDPDGTDPERVAAALLALTQGAELVTAPDAEAPGCPAPDVLEAAARTLGASPQGAAALTTAARNVEPSCPTH